MLTEVFVSFTENIQTVHGIYALRKHLFFLFGQLNPAFLKGGCAVTSGTIINRNTNGLLQKVWVDVGVLPLESSDTQERGNAN